MFTRFALALLLACLTALPARADGVREALGELRTGNFGAAADALDGPSKAGEIAAMNNLAFLYVVGKGVDRDLAKALDLLVPMANAGWALAQYNLGIVYSTQPDILADPAAAQEIATTWFRAAAHGGHVQAQFQLGVRSYLGTGTEKDGPAALAWLALARQHADPALVGQIDKLILVLRKVLTDQEIQAASTLAKAIGPTLPAPKTDGVATAQVLTTQTAGR